MKKLCPPYKGAVPNNVTQGFSKEHQAVDVTGNYGEFLVAPFKALVVHIQQRTTLDNDTSDIAQGCGILMTAIDDPTYRVVYWHCIPTSFIVKVGDIVEMGQPVGQMGNSGMVYGSGQFYTVEEREQEYAEATPSNLPKKGVHVHISMGIGDGTADGTKNVDWRNYVDWTIPINFDLLTTIRLVLKNISNIIK